MAKPLQYVVAWTVKTPDAARSVQLQVGGVQGALELARDLWTRHQGDEIAVRVTTPAGNVFVEWATH